LFDRIKKRPAAKKYSCNYLFTAPPAMKMKTNELFNLGAFSFIVKQASLQTLIQEILNIIP